MDHFYQNLGQDWFTYPNLYSSVVKEFDDNLWLDFPWESVSIA